MRLASLKTGSEHGHGLKSVKRSVDKYGGYMNVSHAGTMFFCVDFALWRRVTRASALSILEITV